MWYEIKDFPDYEITKQGDIRRKDNCRIFSRVYDKDGYLKTALRKDGKRHYLRVHRLVAMTFLPNPKSLPQVNHKNGIKDDNRVENLEWVTAQENVLHTFQELGRKGHNGGMNKQVKQIDIKTGEVLNVFNSIKEASEFVGSKSTAINNAVNGYTETSFGYKWEVVEKM